MLNQEGFDLWADGYDTSVGQSDEDGTYPFAGYKLTLNAIFCAVLSNRYNKVLDIGFGTGTLTKKLYDNGCRIWGQDFSRRMIELAGEKMPEAVLRYGDFSLGLDAELLHNRYDAIIATYSLHHLSDAQKTEFIESCLQLLNENGCLYIGDIAFQTREDLNRCRMEAGEEWDSDEIYFVVDELREHFPQLKFEAFSFCAGLLTISKQTRSESMADVQ